MKKNNIIIASLLVGLGLLGVVAFNPLSAKATTDCVALGGVLNAGECQISSAVTASGTYNLGETLHILTTGQIIVPELVGGNALTLNVAGDFLMDSGAKIVGDNSVANAKASKITINATGTVIVSNGAKISANKGTNSGAGDIVITGKLITIDGTVESAVLTGLTGVGAKQPKDGGAITIDATCDLAIGDTGLVSSRGKDAGADLVHLESGCELNIFGRVESTGAGHAIPNSPVNLCNHANRPDKPVNSTGCVEVWAGNHLTIDSTNGHKGEINADIGITGGSEGRGWIDIFARGDITINDGTDNDHTDIFGSGCTFNSTFAVHANGGLCQNTDDGGLITVKSTNDKVKATGNALQANSTKAGGKGGTITVEAKLDVDMDPNGVFEAKGSSGLGAAHGGQININSYTGDINASSTSTLDVTGRNTPDGTINLTACQAIDFPAGNIIPNNLPALNIVKLPGTCGSGPTIPTYVVLPVCVCSRDDVPVCQNNHCDGTTAVVNQNVTVDFNQAVPTCTGDVDLCNPTVFSYSKVGTDASQWKAIFNLGGRALLVESGATITTSQVGGGNNKKAPGIEINTTCTITVENGGHIVVESLNQQAGDILINAAGDVVVDGEIRDEVKGTNGLPGKIKIETFCGDYTQAKTGQVYVLGVDPGGNEIFIFDHDGNIEISGLVKSFAHAHAGDLTLNRPKIHVAAFDGNVTINADTVEPLYDEYTVAGTKYDLWGGLLSWVRDNVNPGTVEVQAKGNVTVNGHGDDPTGPVRKSFGAVAAISDKSDAPGGVVTVVALEGNIVGNDRAFDVSGRNRLATNFAHITLFANSDIILDRLGANASFNPVVDASAPGVGDKGGVNELRAYNGGITNNINSLISAAVPAGTGSVQGLNILTSCGGVSNSGITNVNPLSIPTTLCGDSPAQILFP